MASYLSSYFGGGAATSSNPQYQQQYQQQYAQANSQPSNQSSSTWGGTFSSRIGALRKALTKDNEEDDPDNEDCSHVSNVLRAYYMEKGRPFPEWLPPDPTKPTVVPAIQTPPIGQYGNMYPGQYGSNGMPHSRGNSGGRGGISDLWDSGPGQSPQPQAQSLRTPRPNPQAQKSFDSSSRQSGSDSYSSQARPLPSQRTGSYQNTQPPPSNPATANPRDRLRARLQGGSSNGRSSSPGATQQGSYNSQGGYDRQNSSSGGPSMSASQPWTSDGNQYGSSGGYGGTSYQQRSGNYR